MTVPGDMHKNMGKMETSITDLQDELNTANKPSKNHFKPGWLFIALLVAATVGIGTYFVASRFANVDKNSVAIKRACEIRNEQITIVNFKFQQLVDLFDESLAHRPPDQPPPSEEIVKLYDAFKKPIDLQDCKKEKALKAVKN